MYPTTAVQYGQTSDAVKQLQNFLISKGYGISVGATGYFGDQTKAALSQWQAANGISASTPGYGTNWGPLSIAAASGGTSAPAATPVPSTSTQQPAQSSPAPTGGSGDYPLGYVYQKALNSAGDLMGTFTYLGNGQWKISDPVHGDYPGTSTTAAVQSNYGLPAPSGGTGAPASVPTSTSTAAFPSVSLEPGSTNTAAVKQLQDYLVSKGVMTQDQVNTGYGVYGPQTTAAVAALQKQLGIDNSSGVGYWGPKTLAAVSSAAGSEPGATPDSNGQLESILNNPNLSADQKSAIKSIFDAVSTNDTSTAEKLKAAISAATQYSSPYFKAQTRLALDALDRGMNAKDGDLAYSEKQLNDALGALRDSTAASKDMLSFAHAQELKNLETDYETKLSDTRDNLAASGFDSSSKRVRAEQILGDKNTGLVESSNKKFSYDTGNLDRTLSTSDASTQAQIANLQRLNSEGNLDLYRTTEGKVGSDNLPAVDGFTPLGGVGGSIPRDQVKDALSFASNFVT